MALVALSGLAQLACGDEAGGSEQGGGGVAGSQLGVSGDGSGGAGAAGRAVGGSGDGGRAGGAGIGEGGVNSGGGATSADGGTTPGDGGAPETDGGTVLPCDGALVDGECVLLLPFARVQSDERTAATGVSSDVVKLAADTTSGNLLVLSVGVIWTGAANTVTPPDGFTLVERCDNTTGAASHESAAIYIYENAPVLPAATGATVSVGEADARLFLVLAEYAGLRASGALDRVASQAGNGAPSPGATAQTTTANELWVVLNMSRGGGGHSAPTNDFGFVETRATGAGSVSYAERLVTGRGLATTSVTGSGDYASVIATLRR